MSYKIRTIKRLNFTAYHVMHVNNQKTVSTFVKSFSSLEEAQAFIEGILYLDLKIQPEHFDDTFEKSYQRYLEGY